MRGTELLGFLNRPFAAAERDGFVEEVRALDARIETLAPTASFRVGAAVARARQAASFTFSRQPTNLALDAWQNANALVTTYVTDDAPIEFERVRVLAGCVLGLSAAAGLRTGPSSFSGHPCPPAGDLAQLVTPFAEAVRAREADVHPIAAAALAQQWITSAHPFDDGNGRTARLLADWILARNGYPPATYARPAAALIAIVDHGRAPIGVTATARVVLHGVAHTVRLLEAP